MILPKENHQGFKKNDVEKINYISKIYNQKWLSRITIKVQDFKLEAIALIDSEADQNVIEEGLIPYRYFEKTKEVLRGANNQQLLINYKLPKVHVCNKDVYFLNTFLLVEDLNEKIILGTLFLTKLYRFTIPENELSSLKFGKKITFEFFYPITPKYISTVEDEIQKYVNRISKNEKYIKFLQDDIQSKKVEEITSRPSIHKRI